MPRLYHWEGSPGSWVDITLDPGGVDTEHHTVSGRAYSFSDYAIMEGETPPGPVLSTPASSEWSLALAGLLGLAGAAIVRWKRTA